MRCLIGVLMRGITKYVLTPMVWMVVLCLVLFVGCVVGSLVTMGVTYTNHGDHYTYFDTGKWDTLAVYPCSKCGAYGTDCDYLGCGVRPAF